MSLVPLSPSPLASSAKVPFKNSIWRPIVALGGALGVGLLVTRPLLQPVAQNTADASSPLANLPELTMQSANTLVVQPSMPPGVLLRGQIRLVADITGKAPVSGAIARQVVDPGAQVRKGDPVLEISSGQAERAAPAIEAVQNRAEKSQIAASDAQLALSQRISLAQTRLRAAQDRVAHSQAQVGSARDLVRRLQNGETVALTELPTTFRDTPRTGRRGRQPRTTVEAAAPRPEFAAARTARQALRENARTLQAARQALLDAQKNARDADDNMKAAEQDVTTAEGRFDQKKASGADVELARGAKKDAENAVNAADRAMIRAKLEVTKLEAAADSLKNGDVAPLPTEAPAAAPDNGPDEIQDETSSNRVTLDQAIKFASAALDESRRASRDAEKIHSEIDDYQRQVTNSSAQVESASKALSTAQQEVLDSVPRPRFTSALAPADGIVTWVSRLAREVGAGQSVFGLARGSKIAAQFEDKEGLWRGLKPGTSLPAMVVTAPAIVTSTGDPASTVPEKALPADNPTVSIKVQEIEAPASDGEAAIVSAEVLPANSINGSGASVVPTLTAGTEILAAMSRPGQKPTLNVPLSALVQRGATTYLAVLAPAPGAISEKGNKAGEDSVFLLRWQAVKTGRGDGMRQEIVSGLAPGTRVVSLLSQLDEMGLTPSSPVAPVAKSKPEATSAGAAAEQIAVRLTADSV